MEHDNDFKVNLRRESSEAEEIAPLLHSTGEKEVTNGESSNIEIPETAHQISTDSWFQIAFILTTGVNSAYVLGYSGTIMVPLGWYGGVIGLILASAISLYASCLVAKLHEYGGKRHIRYRDLAGFIYGKKAYNITWGLQYMNLFMINVGYIILGGSAVKSVYALFSSDEALKLPYCIIITGFVCALFAIGIPHLSALGIWLGFSTVFSFVYFIVAFVLALRDGINSTTGRDYSIPGTQVTKIFTTIGGIANLFFAINTGMLPEIQATVRKPVVNNMLKALYFQFTLGVLPVYAVTFIGYWAYGSSSPTYLLSIVSGPIWLKAVANISAFLQTVITLHIFASPMYEYMDTRCGGGVTRRIVLRGGYLAMTTLLSAMLPFLGDFMSLTGAISTIPLTFILASHMYLKAKGGKFSFLHRVWHWVNVGFFSLMSIAAAVSALRLIFVDSNTYHFFADL